MGKVDRIQEDIQHLVSMNQASQARQSPVVVHPMEEESVVQPMNPTG